MLKGIVNIIVCNCVSPPFTTVTTMYAWVSPYLVSPDDMSAILTKILAF